LFYKVGPGRKLLDPHHYKLKVMINGKP